MENKKDKKFYWIKLRTDFFNQDTIDFLLSQKNGAEYVVLYQMIILQTANNEGQLSTKIGEIITPYTVEKIVRDTKYFDNDTVIVALELYKKLGLIYVENNGTLQIENISTMVGTESANKEAIKKREYRDKIKIGDKKGTNCPTEIRDKRLEIRDKSIDIEKDINTIVEKYNSLGLAQVNKINKTRENKVKLRIEEYGLDFILETLGKVKQSDFLMGKSSDWKMTFDWLFINENNLLKVNEGNYNNTKKSSQPNYEVYRNKEYTEEEKKASTERLAKSLEKKGYIPKEIDGKMKWVKKEEVENEQ